MVHYHRYNIQLKKGAVVGIVRVDEDEESNMGSRLSNLLVCGNSGYCNNKRNRPTKLFSLLFLSLLCCTFILSPQLFSFPSTTFSLFYSLGGDEELPAADVNLSLCSSVSNGTICCDRSSIRSDVCVMKGDVRTHSASSAVFLCTPQNSGGIIDYVPDMSEEETEEELQHEKIKPYTRKWEPNTMATIDELDLISKKKNSNTDHKCDVTHDVPAVFFSTGGYTGNVYHEFNDGLVPLFITSQHFNKKVVFVIVEYHDWWVTKYADVVSLLSDYEPIDFSGDNRTHCFPEAIVGLRIHDELTVDPSLMEGNKSIKDFRNILDQAYWPRIKGLIEEEEREEAHSMKENVTSSSTPSKNPVEMVKGKNIDKKPKLVIISRDGSRAITNEDFLVKMAEKIGFFVEVLKPGRTTELAKVYRSLNSSDVMIGVHGAAMTHFMFMKPGSVFIQVIPLGTDWAADTYYGEPARKLGLKYIGYEIMPKESSLYDEYDINDPVLRDPTSVNDRGWEFTKKIYLDRQKVRLNLGRFRKRLARSYYYTIAKRNQNTHLQSL